ncbi:MAG: hypothetical protein ACOC1K_06945 [Nanoarchaeota archaeon]
MTKKGNIAGLTIFFDNDLSEEMLEKTKIAVKMIKGISYSRDINFRDTYSLRTNAVTNEILLGILLVRDISLKEFAEVIGVTERSVQRWVYEDEAPNETNKRKIEKFLEIPSYILFYNEDAD